MKRTTTAWVLALVALVFAGRFCQVMGQDAPAGGGDAPKVEAADAKAAAPATPPEAAPSGHGGGGGHAEMNFLNIVTRAGWFGEMIWVLLLGSLAACVWLAVDSFMTIREDKISPKALVEAVRGAMEQGDVLKAIACCQQNPVPLANVLRAGFANVEEGFEVIQEMVSVAADLESEKMLQRVTYLSVISNVTPMLGLIGTVEGMIYAFFTLGTQQAGAAQQSMLAVNISQGLWATAVGLGTSVPAMILFYFFKNKAMRIILHMEALTIDLVKSLRNVEVVAE